MRVIHQRQESDCCVAAVANAVGSSYTTVKKICGSTRGGLEHHELVWLLNQFGQWKQITPRRQPTINQFARRHQKGRYILTIHCGVLSDYHTLALVDGEVMGAYSEQWPVSEYFQLQTS